MSVPQENRFSKAIFHLRDQFEQKNNKTVLCWIVLCKMLNTLKADFLSTRWQSRGFMPSHANIERGVCVDC
jgi:hypothetical protein